MLDQITTQGPELVDFSSASVLFKHIEMLQRLTFGGVTIGRYRHKSNESAVIGTTQFTVLVHEGSTFEMDWCVLGTEYPERTRIESGDIQIHPSDTLVYKHWQTPSRMLFLAVDGAFAKQVVAGAFGKTFTDLELKIGIRDPVIGGMAEAWREELRTYGAGGQMCAEALATALIIHLYRMYGDWAPETRAIIGGMPGSRLRQVIAYVEEHLNEDIGLSLLASIAGFSVHHFANVFKGETGLTPHHYLVERRIHRAKELLLGSDAPIAQIAAEVGFSGQSHFSEHFRKLTNMTPLQFRRARGSAQKSPDNGSRGRSHKILSVDHDIFQKSRYTQTLS